MAQPAYEGLSYAQYLELERLTGARHEFLDGSVWAMAGGSVRHAAVAANCIGLLFGALSGGPCRVFGSDLKVRTAETGLATYPDVAIVCGEPVAHPEDEHAVTNPTVVIEVLSPSTEGWDRGGKSAHYQRIDSLRQYLLVDPDSGRVDSFVRDGDGWRVQLLGPGQTLAIEGTDASIAVDSILA